MQVDLNFSHELLIWFALAGRDFPWRKSRDPYAILLAEKLLQQTSVRNSLIDLYLRLLEEYPTPKDLAAASIDKITKLIHPLGLHYRAKDLVLMARDITEKFNGEVPNSLSSLLSLYGVGDYSARAVLSFAYGNDVPVVDTNVARILYRVFGLLGEFPENPARSKKLLELAAGLVPDNKSTEFNWAMIDLGALVCLPSKPKCPQCPLNKICTYNLSQNVATKQEL